MAFVKDATLGVAILSLGISILTFLDQRRSNRRIQAIEEQREQSLADRENSAVLVAKLLHKDTDFGTSYFLDIANIGQASAQQIGMKLDEICASELEYIHDPMMDELGANASKRFQLYLNPGIDAPSRIALTWSDKTGQAKQYNSAL